MKHHFWTLLAFLTIFLFSGCANNPSYKIIITSGEGLIEDCPGQAKAGEVITLHTLTITDADFYVSVNGDEELGSFTEEGVYQFVMPESDVTIKAWVVPNELAEDSSEEDTEAEDIEEPSTEETGTNGTGTGRSGGKMPYGGSSSTTTRKKKSTTATTEVDPDDHDIEAYYDDNRDEYDSFEDAWDGFGFAHIFAPGTFTEIL